MAKADCAGPAIVNRRHGPYLQSFGILVLVTTALWYGFALLRYYDADDRPSRYLKALQIITDFERYPSRRWDADEAQRKLRYDQATHDLVRVIAEYKGNPGESTMWEADYTAKLMCLSDLAIGLYGIVLGMACIFLGRPAANKLTDLNGQSAEESGKEPRLPATFLRAIYSKDAVAVFQPQSQIVLLFCALGGVCLSSIFLVSAIHGSNHMGGLPFLALIISVTVFATNCAVLTAHMSNSSLIATLAVAQWIPVPLLIFLTRWIDVPAVNSTVLVFLLVLLAWMLMVSASIVAFVVPLTALLVGGAAAGVFQCWQMLSKRPELLGASVFVLLWCLFVGGLLYLWLRAIGIFG
jgi:hypothetical protein